MKHSKITVIVALLLCALLLLSGTLLVLHADHTCTGSTCAICPILARCMEIMLCAAVLSVGNFMCIAESGRRYAPSENRFEVEWTPVRQKVKLLD